MNYSDFSATTFYPMPSYSLRKEMKLLVLLVTEVPSGIRKYVKYMLQRGPHPVHVNLAHANLNRNFSPFRLSLMIDTSIKKKKSANK